MKSRVVAFALSVLFFFGNTPSEAYGAVKPVDVIKATFIEHFIHFVEWPKDSLPPDHRFNICVVRSPKLEQALRIVAMKNLFKGRVGVIRNIQDLDKKSEYQGCAALFIARLPESQLARVLRYTKDQPTLTIGATPGYRKAGVMFNLYRYGKNMRFEINEGRAKQAGLRIPAKVLRLSKSEGGAR